MELTNSHSRELITNREMGTIYLSIISEVLKEPSKVGISISRNILSSIYKLIESQNTILHEEENTEEVPISLTLGQTAEITEHLDTLLSILVPMSNISTDTNIYINEIGESLNILAVVAGIHMKEGETMNLGDTNFHLLVHKMREEIEDELMLPLIPDGDAISDINYTWGTGDVGVKMHKYNKTSIFSKNLLTFLNWGFGINPLNPMIAQFSITSLYSISLTSAINYTHLDVQDLQYPLSLVFTLQTAASQHYCIFYNQTGNVFSENGLLLLGDGTCTTSHFTQFFISSQPLQAILLDNNMPLLIEADALADYPFWKHPGIYILYIYIYIAFWFTLCFTLITVILCSIFYLRDKRKKTTTRARTFKKKKRNSMESMSSSLSYQQRCSENWLGRKNSGGSSIVILESKCRGNKRSSMELRSIEIEGIPGSINQTSSIDTSNGGEHFLSKPSPLPTIYGNTPRSSIEETPRTGIEGNGEDTSRSLNITTSRKLLGPSCQGFMGFKPLDTNLGHFKADSFLSIPPDSLSPFPTHLSPRGRRATVGALTFNTNGAKPNNPPTKHTFGETFYVCIYIYIYIYHRNLIPCSKLSFISEVLFHGI